MKPASAYSLLYDYGLIKWSSGNVSQRWGSDSFCIKKSGVTGHDEPASSSLVCVGYDGVVQTEGKPSTDSEAHRYIYNHIPEVCGIVHTHSTYATAFALAGVPIPCVSTALADEFGGDVPVSAYCEIGGEDIGKEVVRLYESTKCPVILIRQHGVFTVGNTVQAAVKSAVMVEECAKQVWIAMQFHGPAGIKRLAEDAIKRNFKRYHESYGQ